MTNQLYYPAPSHELMIKAQQYHSLTEMAQAYSPWVCTRQARRRLNETILRNQELMEHLASTGFKMGQRNIFPIHAAVIMMHLGEPSGTL